MVMLNQVRAQWNSERSTSENSVDRINFASTATNVATLVAASLQSLQTPIGIPARERLPVPPQTAQEVALWP
jgi:hypothetical protein